ncbi:hypothetical protein DFJ77DRAFT_508301 [Powellomyces hirtus]|nr:hypothetical protein DFJ77DRAFT_508301 [Powellomyces hirtus]
MSPKPSLVGKLIYIINAKLAPKTLEKLSKAAESKGARIVSRAKDADVVVTKLTSAARISKYIDLKSAMIPPVAKLGWLEQCVEKEECPALVPPLTVDLTPCIEEAAKDANYIPPATETGCKRAYSDIETGPIIISSRSPSPASPASKRQHISSTTGPKNWISSDSEVHSDLHSDELSDGASESSNSEGSDGDAEYERNIALDPTYNNVAYEVVRKHPLDHYNKELVEQLSLIEKQREIDGEARSALSYRRAISALISYPRKIRSWREAKKIKGVGDKIARMIREYLKTGTIQAAETVANSSRFLIISHFASIYGVGPTTARDWYGKGYRSLEDVLDAEGDTLSNVVKMGIELFPDFQQKMTRKDVEEIVEVLEEVLRGIDEGFAICPVGGYRRGKEINGDCDVVITHPEEAKTKNLLRQLVDALKAQGYVKHVLWYGEGHEKDQVSELRLQSGKKNSFDHLSKAFTGFRQPSTGINRQVDLIISPQSLYACAVLGWTGSKQFERGLRNWCKYGGVAAGHTFKGGYHFASHGLFDRRTNKRVHVETEEDIFKFLKLEWTDPTLRNA